MKRIIGLALMGLIVSAGLFAQKEESKEKKKPLSKRIWGNYDSNAVKKNLIIRDAFVTEGEEMLEGVRVVANVNGKPYLSDTTDKEGGFTMDLKYDYRYILSFEKTGYVTKLVEIDLSNMPLEAKKE
jgi:hypothetical protein